MTSRRSGGAPSGTARAKVLFGTLLVAGVVGAIACIAVLQWSDSEQPSVTNNCSSAEVYQRVVSALVLRLATGHEASPGPNVAAVAVVRDRTRAGFQGDLPAPFSRFLAWEDIDPDELQGLTRETYDSFVTANQAEQTIVGIDMADRGVHVIQATEYDGLFSGLSPPDGWARVANEYGEGVALVAFSALGVSQDGAEALVYIEISRGVEDGSGMYVHLHCIDGAWQITGKLLIWLV